MAGSEEFDAKRTRMSPLTSALQLDEPISIQVAFLRPEERTRADEQDDALFYSVPRFVQYIDEHFDREVKDWYRQHLKEGDDVLELCSSYDSHLPEISLNRVMGHGMCGPEMAANPVLESYFTKDLNEDPSLPCAEESYDHVLCCMGLQYLKYPEDICQEVYRVLKPEGKFLVSFTSHCFPEKTLTGWLERTLEERAFLVDSLMRDVGFEDVECVASEARLDCPDVISDSVMDCMDLEMCPIIDFPRNGGNGTSSFGQDPFYGVVGVKPSEETTSASEAALETAPFGLDVLNELDLNLDSVQQPYTRRNRLLAAYKVLCQWAISLGIPESVILLPREFDTLESLKQKRDHMKSMIASFVSSNI